MTPLASSKSNQNRSKNILPPQPKTFQARGIATFTPASWTAPAERSGDGAFARTGRQRTNDSLRPQESGVALRFSPQSKPSLVASWRLGVFALFAASLFAVSARADLVLEQRTSDADQAQTTTLKLHNDKMRMDEPGEYFSVIIDLNTRDSISLFTNIKKYLKRSGAEIQRQMEKEKQAGGTNGQTAPPAAAVDTGKSETVSGLKTEIYTWTGANGLVETLWVATNFPNYDTIKTELVKLDKFNAMGSHPNAQPQLSRLPGMVMKSESVLKGHKSTTTLISVKVEPVDASLFELPSGYTPWKPPGKSKS